MHPTLKQLLDLLSPLMGTPPERQAQLRLAFGLRSPVTASLDWMGDTQTFITNMSDTLQRGGHLATLLESVREQVGTNLQVTVDSLIAALQTLPQMAFAPMLESEILPVFLSYSRVDREAATALYATLQETGLTLWRDIHDIPAGAIDWWTEIRSAIDACGSMILCLSLAALQSTIVGDEWNYAKSQGKRVIPVIVDEVFGHAAVRSGQVIVPAWMQRANWVDLRPDAVDRAAGWDNLIRTLRTPYTPKPVHITVKASQLPHNFVPRPLELAPLVNALSVDDPHPTVAIIAALKGAGGYGKTTLAKALCRDWRVSGAFTDGIFWVTLGEKLLHLTAEECETALLKQIVGLVAELRPDLIIPPLLSLERASELLHKALEGLRVLLVIDDVWEHAHLEPFLVQGKHHATLITTRFEDTIPRHSGVIRQPVAQMEEHDALALLSFGIEGWEAEREWFATMAGRLGRSAQLLGIANSALTDRLRADDKGRVRPLQQALREIAERLDHYGVTVFDPTNPTERDQAFGKTLEVGIERLSQIEQEHFRALGIFPDDVPIPLTTLDSLWARGRIPTATFCEKLAKSSLVQDYDETHLTLHDVTLKYLRSKLADPAQAHYNLLLINRWRDSMPDGYAWRYHAYHLLAAGRRDELRTYLLDFRYLQSKIQFTDVAALLADFAAYLSQGHDEAIQLVRSALSMSAHVLATHPLALAHQLVGRLMIWRKINPELVTLTEQAMSTRPLMRPLFPDSDYATHDMAGDKLIMSILPPEAALNLVYSPNGHFILSASKDKTLRVWEAATGRLTLTLTGHTDAVNMGAYSPDGTRIVSASKDQTAKVWEATSGQLLATLTGHTDAINSAVFAPDGKHILTASKDKTLKVWEIGTEQVVRTLRGHTRAVTSAVYSANGRYILSTAEDRTLKLWDAATERTLHTFTGHTKAVITAIFSPDGRSIISGAADCTIRIWDANSGWELQALVGHMEPITSVSCSADGRYILSTSLDNTLKVWDAASGNEITTLAGHTREVMCGVFNPMGKHIVSASLDNTVKVWDATAMQPEPKRISSQIAHASFVRSTSFSPDGRHVLTAALDNVLMLWEATTGLPLHWWTAHGDTVFSAAYSPDGRYIVSTSWDNLIKVWEAPTGALHRTLIGHTHWVAHAEFSPDNRRVASASWDDTVKVWDAESGEEIQTLRGHTGRVLQVAFSPDGQFLASASVDKTLRVWDADMREVRVISGHRSNVASCMFSPNGRYLLSASKDRTLRVWEAATGREVHLLSGHTRSVTFGRYSPTGEFILSASKDQTIRVWEASTGRQIYLYHADAGVGCCGWSPDGKSIVAGDEAGRVLFLRWLP